MTAASPTVGWQHRAACRGLPTGLFYPPTGAPAAEALAVCARCPVRAECDEHARAHGEEYGVWGGRTEAERARLTVRPPDPVHAARRPGPPPALSDDELVELVWSLDPDRPAAAQIMERLGVSVPTAYKYLHRAVRLGVIEQRGRHLHPAT